MSVKVTTRLTRRLGKIKPFPAETEIFDNPKDAIRFLREELGQIYGTDDIQWMKDITQYGYEITIEEIKK